MHIYLGDYNKALNDFGKSSGIMHANKVLYPRGYKYDENSSGDVNPADDNASHASSQTDLSDVGLCSLNIHEYSFNCLIC